MNSMYRFAAMISLVTLISIAAMFPAKSASAQQIRYQVYTLDKVPLYYGMGTDGSPGSMLFVAFCDYYTLLAQGMFSKGIHADEPSQVGSSKTYNLSGIVMAVDYPSHHSW